MTRKQFNNFIAAVHKAAKNNDLDQNVMDVVLDDDACRHEFRDVLNPNSDEAARLRLTAAVAALDADPLRGPVRYTLFKGE